MRKVVRGVVAVGLAAVLAGTGSGVGTAEALSDVNTRRLREAVTVNGILQHERAFQRIARANGGTRASGTPGYDASVRYVARTLRRAGYSVRRQSFEFPFFRELAPASLQQVTPSAVTYETTTFTYSGSGAVTGEIVPIEVQIPPPATPGSTSGCEPADFPAAPAGPAVALIQRGTCTFEIKAANAQAAGYEAVIIFNEGQAGRTEVLSGTLESPVTIPVVGASFEEGAALVAADAASPGATVRVATSTESRIATTQNVIADSPRGKVNETVVVGAHLDSVVENAGINDDGSGSAAILEIAREMAELKYTRNLQRRVRFAFWGAEEFGVLGSEYYLDSLNPRQFSRIYANLNFDMLGSPNYVRFVYDGDGSDSDPAGPPGAGEIERVFTDYFDSQGLASEPTGLSGSSDYAPFLDAGIPVGGLFTGATGLKTPAQAAEYGGTAGVAYDPCYHEECDTVNNLNAQALSEMGDAAAHAVLTLARSKSGLFPDASRQGKQQRALAAKTLTQKGPLNVR